MSNKVDIVVSGVDQSAPAKKSLQEINSEVDALGGKTVETARKTTSATGQMNADWLKMAAGIGLTLAAIEQGVQRITLLAARVETLGVVMHVVGNNAGYTGAQMDVFANQVQKMGITTKESMSSLIKMAGAQIDLSKAADLARVAQDAAVIGGINSSEAFGRMIQGISSGEVEILKTMGIQVQFEQAYKSFAATLGKTSEQLTATEKTTARMNSVLEYGTNIAGAYEASMTTAGKQLLSMARPAEELALKLGALFTPSLSFAVTELTRTLKDLDSQVGKNSATVDNYGQNFKVALVSVAAEIQRVSMLLDLAGGTMTAYASRAMKVAEVATRFMTIGQFGDWFKQKSEDLAKANAAYAARFAAGEKELQRLADSLNPTATGRTAAQEQAAIAAAAASRAAAEKTAATATTAATAAAAKKAQEEQAAYRKKYEDEIIKASEDERKRRQKVLIEQTHDVEEHMNAVQKLYEDQQKASASLSRLSIENKLAEINVEEKFYQLTTGDAAEKRIDLLEESLKLENAAYKAVVGNTSIEELERAKILKIISATNAALLEQEKILNDTSAWGAARSALDDYSRAAADIGAQTKGLVTDMLQGMEDSLASFVRTAKFNFKNLSNSVSQDLSRIISKMAIAGMVSKGAAVYNYWTTDSADKSYGVQSSNANSGFGGGDWFGSAGTAYTGGKAAYTAFAPSTAGSGVAASGAGEASGASMGLGAWGAIGAAIVMGIGQVYEDIRTKEFSNRSFEKQQIWWSTAGLGMNLLDKFTGGGMFGTNQWRGESSGLSLGIENGDVSGQNYQTQTQKKSFWRGKNRRDVYSDMDPLVQEFLSSQYGGVTKGIQAGSRILGASGDLSGFSSDATKISLSGLDAKGQQEAIESYFRRISTEAIDTLYPEIEAFAKLGEDSTDTFQRLTSSLKMVNDNFTLLNIPLNQLGLDGAAVADTLVQALGGLDSATKAFADYYSSGLFTEAEQKALQVQAAQNALNDTFAQLGLTLPRTNDEFKVLVNSQLALGASGADTAAVLLRVAPAFATVTDSVQQAVTGLAEANSRIIDTAKQVLLSTIDATGSILGALRTLMTGPLANLSPESAYRQAQAQWASSDASNAAERGLALAEASRGYNASGSAYQADIGGIKERLATLAEVTPTLSFVEQQIKLLGEIKAAVEAGDSAQLAALQVTFNAAQISIGNTGTSLSGALTGIQQIFDAGIIDASAATAGIDSAKLIINTALAGTIDGTTAAQALAIQGNTVQQALNGTISGAEAALEFAAQYRLIQDAANGAISSTDAATKISEQYDIISATLADGTSSALGKVSDALSAFNTAIATSAADTAKGLTNFITAMEIMQSYPIQKTAYDTQSGALRAQYISGAIGGDDYNMQATALYNPARATYDRGVAAGLTTLAAPTWPADYSTLADERMRSYASTNLQTIFNMAAGLIPADLKYDIAPVGSPNGGLNVGDVSVWQQIATGSRLWSSLGLPVFANGGITSGPSIAGEGIYREAIVPLPNGRSIPVQMSGSADNKETVAELKEQNRLLRQIIAQGQASIKTNQAGFTALVDGQQQGNKSLKTVESGTTLAKRAA